MKKFIHPKKRITLIKFQNGASFIKSWVYYRTFINDSSSISRSHIIKLKKENQMKKRKKEEKDKIKFTEDHNIFLNELNNIHSSFTDYAYSDDNNHTLEPFDYVYPEDYEPTYDDNDFPFTYTYTYD